MQNRKRFNYWMGITLLITGMFILFFIYPIGKIVVQSVFDFETGSFDVSAFTEFFSKSYYTDTIWNSLKVSLAATAVASVIGVSMAYIFRKYKIRGKQFLEISIISSIISPPFIGAYAWVLLLGRNGTLTKIINSIFNISFNGIYGFWGIVFIMSLKMFPMVFLYISGALKSIDDSINEASLSLGSSSFKTIFTVTLPLIMPTFLSSFLLVFMRCLSDFGTPMLIGEGYRTLPVLIYSSFIGEMGTNEAFGSAIAVIIISVTIVIFMIQDWLANKANVEMTALRPMEPEKAKPLVSVFVHLYSYLTVLITVIPLLVVVFTSFLEVKGSLFTDKFSFSNYQIVFSKLGSSISNTFLFSTISIIIIVVIGVLVSYISVRKPNIFSKILDSLIMIPYVVPGSVVGIALIGAFNKKPILLLGSMWIIIIAYVIRRLPYTIRSTNTILRQVNPNIEEASQSLGDTGIQTLLKVSVPAMIPGIVSGALMSWMSIISELSASVILYVGSTRTLSISIYSEVIRGNYGTASALSTILLVLTSAALMLFFKISKNKDLSI